MPPGSGVLIATGLPADGARCRHRTSSRRCRREPGQPAAARQSAVGRSQRPSRTCRLGQRARRARARRAAPEHAAAALAWADWPLLRQLRGEDRPAAVRQSSRQRPRRGGRAPPTADRVVKSVCPYCAVGCAQNVYVKDERVVQIEGDPDAPHSRGRLCPKGSATLQLTTGASRERHVLYRPPYASDWERLDLETAMDMVAEKFVAIARADGSGSTTATARARCMSIAALGGATLDNEENYLIKKFLTAARDRPDREPGARLPLLDGRRSRHLVRSRRLEHAARRPAELRPDRARGLEHGRGPSGRLPVGRRGEGARRDGDSRRSALQPDERARRHVRAAARRAATSPSSAA